MTPQPDRSDNEEQSPGAGQEDPAMHLEHPTGSPQPGEPVFLVVGRLRRPHGIRGEITMEVVTDFPERLRPRVTVYVGDERRPLKIRSRRSHQQALLVAFQDIDTPAAAGELKNQLVYVRAADRPPLPAGEFYHHEILGLRVVTDEDRFLGILTQILDTAGANDVYVVRPESGPEILLPAIEPVILNIDLDRGEIRVHILPGLIPE